MAWPLIIAAAVQIAGQYMSNQAEADVEEQNARFLRAQAELAQAAGDREAKIFSRQASYEQGQRITAYGAANVDVGSGSALALLASEGANAMNELAAIRYNTEMNVRLARERGQLTADKANTLRSTSYNTLQAGSTVLNTFASYDMRNSPNKTKTVAGGNPGGNYIAGTSFSSSSYPGYYLNTKKG